jgi:DNA-binding GntR family transcriptional regulator
MNSEETVLAFAASIFRSVWALELLLVMKRNPDRNWKADALIRELRSSRVVVIEAMANLSAAGLVVQQDGDSYRYHPLSDEIDSLVSDLQRIYAEKPASVMREIVTNPNRKLQQLSDAFKFKE